MSDSFDLRDRWPLYVDDIAPLLSGARLAGVCQITVRVTPSQHADLKRRLRVMVPLASEDPWGGSVKFDLSGG